MQGVKKVKICGYRTFPVDQACAKVQSLLPDVESINSMRNVGYVGA